MDSSSTSSDSKEMSYLSDDSEYNYIPGIVPVNDFNYEQKCESEGDGDNIPTSYEEFVPRRTYC